MPISMVVAFGLAVTHWSRST